MNGKELLERYANGERNFQGAKLNNANLYGTNLNNANLKYADLQGVDLRCANLKNAKLKNANLYGTNLNNANLKYADLQGVDLRCANFQGADLEGANFQGADLNSANLKNAKLKGARLDGADLEGANLEGANLKNAKLIYAKLYGADLKNAKGLLNTKEWMDKTFEKTDEGYIVYKAFNCMYTPPSHWEIKKGSIIEEHVNLDRCVCCSYGINFATKDWIENEYPGKVIWKCLIRFEDIEATCVPYATDGKARCAKLTLLNEI
jgi:hypothetical protein